MDPEHDLVHRHMERIAAGLLLGATSESAHEIEAAGRYAEAGCSRCARALVNARELTADLAFGEPARPAAPALRARVLEAARARRSPVEPAPAALPRVLDPSAAVAHKHIGAPGDAGRTAEIDALGAREPREGEVTPRLLGELQSLVRFPVLFVSVVRGERVGYRVERGAETRFPGFRELRREMSYCSHCVSQEAPLVVQNAGGEPFFRGSRMVVRYNARAYAGVPLRSSRGILVGTLCALDTEARVIPPEIVQTLELYARLVLGEIERFRGPGPAAPPPSRVHAKAWMSELLGVELAHVARGGRRSALLGVPAAAAEALAALAIETEPVGELGGGAVGLLLPATKPGEAEVRRAELGRALGERGFPADLPGLAFAGDPADCAPSAASWSASAVGPG